MHVVSKLLVFSILIFSFAAHASDYSGQQDREVKSLSKSDIEDLSNGRGWGLAKPAELNGLPGPLHLLEMKDELDLSDDQIKRINRLYFDMKQGAIKLGEQYIENERNLEILITSTNVTEEELSLALQSAASKLAELRFVHLRAHLQTPDIISVDQISKYNQLRGYTTASPCANPPKGHDISMWKQHNNCS